ncbi:MAG TPA: hypothetical protein PKX48_01020 [Planctomycetota bacterium]|jgi:hypothetical protein|nr:hypothetical protein [Planctomycetota bacterium]OQC22000.1 MAG: hypothetical protein BWX69_00308 [Planctomycetes bacterium ADurb.Bin069]NMD36097.1 hypothetical protein [Planctomycetota bacterium]HNR98116.1 hypothetical protein [Planctomycetota bacterium]HNU25521.1 hypothetical protein [Planctomycetota bacterium]
MRRGIALLCAAAALGAAALLERGTRACRPAMQSGMERQRGDSLPPAVQLASTLLGSFRALLVDYLWIHAETLQNEGRFFAAAEAARWITMLQSRVEGSWSFQAWNLGVNVPSSLPPEERWPYVRAAVELLWRDGLAANPRSLGLHWEIAWFWAYKIGGEIDAAGPRYRAEVESAGREILGAEPWDPAAFAAAEALLPALRRDPAVARFAETLAALGVGDVEGGWTALWAAPEAVLGDAADALAAALREDPLLEAYDRGLRARAWRRTFGVGMDVVAKAHGRFGDVGLLRPESFVLFWARHGLEQLAPDAVRLDAIALWRMELRALTRLFQSGEIALLAAIDREYAEAAARAAGDSYHRKQEASFLEDRIQFLKGAIPLAYISGTRRGRELAEEHFAKLAELDPAGTPRVACEDYVYDWIYRKVNVERATRDELLAVIRAFLREALRAAARGEDDGARTYLDFARGLYGEAAAVFTGPEFPSFDRVAAQARRELAPARGGRAKGRAG